MHVWNHFASSALLGRFLTVPTVVLYSCFNKKIQSLHLSHLHSRPEVDLKLSSHLFTLFSCTSLWRACTAHVSSQHADFNSFLIKQDQTSVLISSAPPSPPKNPGMQRLTFGLAPWTTLVTETQMERYWTMLCLMNMKVPQTNDWMQGKKTRKSSFTASLYEKSSLYLKSLCTLFLKTLNVEFKSTDLSLVHYCTFTPVSSINVAKAPFFRPLRPHKCLSECQKMCFIINPQGPNCLGSDGNLFSSHLCWWKGLGVAVGVWVSCCPQLWGWTWHDPSILYNFKNPMILHFI